MRNWIDRVLLLLVVAVATASMAMVGIFPSASKNGDEIDQINTNPPSHTARTLAPDKQSESTGLKPGGANLESLYRVCGGQVEEAYVTGWARFDGRESTEEELRSLIAELVQPLEAAVLSQQEYAWPPGVWVTGSLGEARGVNYSRVLGADQRIEAWARSASYGGDAYPEKERMTYLVVQVVGLPEIQMAAPVSCIIEESLRQMGVEGRISSGMVCWREGRMEPLEMRNLALKVLDAAYAREVENLEQPGFISVTAFSPFIPEEFDLDGERVNLQLASRYHELDDRTYIHLGIPLIMTDY